MFTKEIREEAGDVYGRVGKVYRTKKVMNWGAVGWAIFWGIVILLVLGNLG